MAGKPSVWTPERVAALEDARARGLSRSEIAALLGVSFDSLKCQLDRMASDVSEDDRRYRLSCAVASAELRDRVLSLAARHRP
jgi:hypothetical protein